MVQMEGPGTTDYHRPTRFIIKISDIKFSKYNLPHPARIAKIIGYISSKGTLYHYHKVRATSRVGNRSQNIRQDYNNTRESPTITPTRTPALPASRSTPVERESTPSRPRIPDYNQYRPQGATSRVERRTRRITLRGVFVGIFLRVV